MKRTGFLPLFSNEIPGFSVEERTTASSWWTGTPETDPWEWRILLSRHPDIAYGKFFNKKAGFVSKRWFPVFANYRRDGYDFEAYVGDELASYRARKNMEALDHHRADRDSPECTEILLRYLNSGTDIRDHIRIYRIAAGLEMEQQQVCACIEADRNV